jgi:hypothetical protein
MPGRYADRDPRSTGPRGRGRGRWRVSDGLLGGMAAIAVAGLVAAIVAISGDSHRSVGAGQQLRANASPAATTTTTVDPFEPGGGRQLFPSHRIVAFYGAPAEPALGVLGEAPAERLWPRLAAAAAPYGAAGVTVIPSYDLIAYTAQAAAGPAGTYTARLSDEELDTYATVVKEHGGMLILDIQPGLSGFLADAKTLAAWLERPDVGLALDPEWEISPGQVPGEVIGHTTAAEVNQVSAWLSQLTAAHHLPQKLLLVHQFTRSMVENKAQVLSRAHVAIAFNMDGFGAPSSKRSVYRILARDRRWALGYKLFYQRDTPLQTPAQVLALHPTPDIVEYE